MTTATVAPLARELNALTDAELDQYLEQHNRVISVQDPGQLPESFIERLRDRARRAREDPALDLDQLNIRLIAAAQQPTPEQSPSHSRSPTCSPPPIEDKERQEYEELVRAGGRPGYPLDLVEDVFRNPTKHRDILLPFLTTPSDWECPIVFTKQLGR
ncbi:hypothetical protein F5883DRAFT_241575 [Diaporthe sp. PMI_573]|nr:hypothetical protein F5883DRAFT_241575 [Diaporthaceae sp. PMI_573]